MKIPQAGRTQVNTVAHGDDQMLIPVRTAEGHINVIPLSLHQPPHITAAPAAHAQRQTHYYSLPHIMVGGPYCGNYIDGNNVCQQKNSEQVFIEKFVGTLWVNLAFFFVSFRVF